MNDELSDFPNNQLKHQDRQGILLKPNPELGEIGVLNCSTAKLSNSWPKPILIRARIKKNNSEFSRIKLAYLTNPTSVSDSIVLITPTEEYEKNGCEDPHLETIGDTHYITYVAIAEPNAQIALATASEDFSKITKHGIISPNISLEEAINLVPVRKYKRRWETALCSINKEKTKLEPKIYVKDGLLHKEGNKWHFFYRIEPDVQHAVVDNLDELHNDDFWRNEIKNFKDKTCMKTENGWAKIKIGFGALYDFQGEHLGLYHGVSGRQKEPSILRYKGSLFKGNFNRDKFNLEARLRDALLIPKSENTILTEGQNKKAIYFLTAAAIDPKDPNTLFLYFGIGDKEIGFKTISIPWFIKELNNPHNYQGLPCIA